MLQLKEFVNSRVETVEPGDRLQRAAEKMRGLDVGSLPVCDNGQLVGVITNRDITIRAVAKGGDPATVVVREIMTRAASSTSSSSKHDKTSGVVPESPLERLWHPRR